MIDPRLEAKLSEVFSDEKFGFGRQTLILKIEYCNVSVKDDVFVEDDVHESELKELQNEIDLLNKELEMSNNEKNKYLEYVEYLKDCIDEIDPNFQYEQLD